MHGIGDRFQEAFDVIPSPALLLDESLAVYACNRAYERMTRTNRTNLQGRRLLDLLREPRGADAEALRDSLARVLRDRRTHQTGAIHYDLKGPKGQAPFCVISNIPLLSPDGDVVGVLHCPAHLPELMRPGSSGRPVPESTSLSATSSEDVRSVLQAERERLWQLFRQAPGFICVLRGPQHVFELANDAYYQLVGHREIIGRVLAEVLPEVISQGFLEKLDRVYWTGEPFIGRALPIQLQRVAHGELEQRYIDLVYQPILDGNHYVTGIFVQGHDVTDAHTLAQEVAYQATHDSLTGLRNRRGFARQTEAIAGDGPHALLYMDIDHFKIVNDRCGHEAGDSLLIEVANTLQAQCDGSSVLARLGGDEFALICPNCDLQAASEFAHELRRAVQSQYFVWEGRRHTVTLSAGVAAFGAAPSLPFGAALGLADAACFLAKEKGRNRVQVAELTDEEVRQQQHDMDSVGRLKDAIGEDRIILYVQRIDSLGSLGRGMLHEVLARLKDPGGVIVPPSGFIPAAERFGLIGDLDRHIFRKAFAHLAGIDAADETRRLFVNLSAVTLSSPGFLAFVEATMAAYPSVRPSQVCFEVTETAAVTNIRRTAGAMAQLREKGFEFALDDFGSGMASFSYLKQLPVKYVKIDGEFIKGVARDSASAAIVSSVAKVARSMSVQTIAESVEYPELIPRLRQLGVDYVQGFAIHRPEPLS